MAKYYAVVKGRIPGVYKDWEDAKAQVLRFPNAVFKGFKKESDALDYYNEHSLATNVSDNYLDHLDNADSCVAFIDGSCTADGNKAGSGVVLLYGSSIKHPKQGNIIGELNSAIEAMNVAYNAGFKKLTLFYDYQGIEEIALGRWEAKSQEMRQYKEAYEKYADVMELNFVKIKGHSDIMGNELADEIAKHSLSMR